MAYNIRHNRLFVAVQIKVCPFGISTLSDYRLSLFFTYFITPLTLWGSRSKEAGIFEMTLEPTLIFSCM